MGKYNCIFQKTPSFINDMNIVMKREIVNSKQEVMIRGALVKQLCYDLIFQVLLLIVERKMIQTWLIQQFVTNQMSVNINS